MLINARHFIVRIFLAALYFVMDVAYWIMDTCVGIWTTIFGRTSAALNRASKWVKPPTLTIVFEDRWMRVLVVHRKRVIAWDTFSRPTPFSAPAANVESQNNWLAHRLKEFLKSKQSGICSASERPCLKVPDLV